MYVNLVDRLREAGAEISIFSSLHVSGQQLTQIGGIAAILLYSCPGLDEDIQEDDDSDKEDPRDLDLDGKVITVGKDE